ncbi:YgdB family protein [Pectobacterium aroidearum]|uniref:YgdB family protein n=1 Tax=Pectobacterium aroidearum TaxID=1201031 RepID=UPI001CD66AFB|nr:YgdB family protein [Pectobacterium aroidearum]UUE44136.1 YgdB family protein [Pectobacterium aroidearum]UUE48355.1 YgdB family protein [Pectobacterium aroidearum]UUE52560.1 YgdB family protein [Pectobacterium aroidearum]UUE60970.1 YgdB family protein [Pectobacterium aroidearum]UUE65192.1 YgdB family protein [Pectobacterium aroidearum]
MKQGLQKGSGTLAMVLLIAAIGLLLMSGLQRQLESAIQVGNDERHYLRAFNQALSSLNWGIGLRWRVSTESWQCQQLSAEQLVVCLRAASDGKQGVLRGEGTLPASTRTLKLYQRVSFLALSSGQIAIQPLANGWLDFCPDKEVTRCDATE